VIYGLAGLLWALVFVVHHRAYRRVGGARAFSHARLARLRDALVLVGAVCCALQAGLIGIVLWCLVGGVVGVVAALVSGLLRDRTLR